MIVQNFHLENYTNYLIPTLIQTNSDSDTGSLLSLYYWESPDKDVAKIRISEPFEEATEWFKESVVSLVRHIYSKRSQNRHCNHVKESLDHE